MPMLRSLGLFVLPVALAACGGSGDFEPAELPMSRIQAFWAYQDTNQTYVVRSEAHWQQVWAEHEPRTIPRTERPDVDFEQSMVLGITLGIAPNGCYGLAIRKIVEEKLEIRVEYRYFEPPKDVLVLCTQAIVALTDFVVVPRSEKPVYFLRTDT